MTPDALRWMGGSVVDLDHEESRSARDWPGPDCPGDPRRYRFDGEFVEEYERGDEL